MRLRRCFVSADPQAANDIAEPVACPAQGCEGSKFQRTDGPPMLGDWQECRLQEATGQLALGAKPASVALILTNDIAESCLPGGAHQPASP